MGSSIWINGRLTLGFHEVLLFHAAPTGFPHRTEVCSPFLITSLTDFISDSWVVPDKTSTRCKACSSSDSISQGETVGDGLS